MTPATISVFLIGNDPSSVANEALVQAFEGVNVSCQFIAPLTQESEADDRPPSLLASNEQQTRRFYRDISEQEQLQYQTHQLVWQQIIDQQLDYALVLDSKVTLSGSLSPLLDALQALHKQRTKFEWDYVMLADSQLNKGKAIYRRKLAQMELLTYKTIPLQASAQAISARGAQRLLDNSKTIARPLVYDLRSHWDLGIEVLGLAPYVFDGAQSVEASAQQTASVNYARCFLQSLERKVTAWSNTRLLVVKQQELR
ncbi:glycosyltransferase family 25 protein [Paraferrimonas haliotis]|uniref:Glycosyl transferase family 25 domain-containing protein n=1 Tax=Paraferrimonas haliotis TaxID=2013866 RepID=A0AA37TP98_9GAMM|nr:glycosyltransferase family 25 protein [Paraferrimonas haliotis]GLS83100.1 hypothetical protein GCM10007894_10770 [Paraferrimonas haliotis]